MTERINGVLHATVFRLRLLMPYLVVAVLVPGGSVLAVMLWLQLHHQAK